MAACINEISIPFGNGRVGYNTSILVWNNAAFNLKRRYGFTRCSFPSENNNPAKQNLRNSLWKNTALGGGLVDLNTSGPGLEQSWCSSSCEAVEDQLGLLTTSTEEVLHFRQLVHRPQVLSQQRLMPAMTDLRCRLENPRLAPKVLISRWGKTRSQMLPRRLHVG